MTRVQAKVRACVRFSVAVNSYVINFLVEQFSSFLELSDLNGGGHDGRQEGPSGLWICCTFHVVEYRCVSLEDATIRLRHNYTTYLTDHMHCLIQSDLRCVLNAMPQ